jgi:hypothetical protein
LNSTARIARLLILVLVLATGVFAANEDAARSWMVETGILQQPLQSAPLYVGVEGPLVNYAGVDVISKDKAIRLDNIIMTAPYTAGTKPIAPGTEIYLHVYSVDVIPDPNYSSFYDEWYHVIVGQNQPVHRLRPGLSVRNAPAPIGEFDEEYYGKMVMFSTGGAMYWRITQPFLLQWRNDVDDASMGSLVKFNLQNPDGVSIRNATEATAASGTPDSAAADFTTTSPQFTLKLTVYWQECVEPDWLYGCMERVYGKPMLFLGPPPNYDWRIGYLVIWISFNNTNIGTDYLAVNGWTRLNQVSTTGYLNFYKPLPPLETHRGQADCLCAEFNIPVDTSHLSAGTGISMRIWMADLQVPVDAAQGVSHAVPSPYGGVTRYGLRGTIFANGFMTSTNKPTAQLIWTAFKIH